MSKEEEEEFEQTELIEKTTFICDMCGDEDIEFCERCGRDFTEYSTVYCDGNEHICEKCYQSNR